MLPVVVRDGVLGGTPAGSAADNLAAHGPIRPRGSGMIALTPISPFRPRRWRGAILPEKMVVRFEVLDPVKRPVSAVGDQREVRDVACVDVAIDRSTPITLLFDPEHALDDRIAMEQFISLSLFKSNRSEERRVGEECFHTCKFRWLQEDIKKK